MNNFPTPPHTELLPSTWSLTGPAANGDTNVAPRDVIYQYELGDAWWWLGAMVHVLPALIALALGLAFDAPVIAVAAVPLAAVSYLISIRPTLTRLMLTSDAITCQTKFAGAITMPYALVTSTSRRPMMLKLRTQHGTFKLRDSFLGGAKLVAGTIALYRALPVAPLAFRAHPGRQPARILVAPAYSGCGRYDSDGVMVRHGELVAFVQNDRSHLLIEAIKKYFLGLVIGRRLFPLERWLADAAQTGDMVFIRSLAKLVDHCGGFIVAHGAVQLSNHGTLLSKKRRIKFTFRGTKIETQPVHPVRAQALAARGEPAERAVQAVPTWPASPTAFAVSGGPGDYQSAPRAATESVSPWDSPTVVTPMRPRFGT